MKVYLAGRTSPKAVHSLLDTQRRECLAWQAQIEAQRGAAGEDLPYRSVVLEYRLQQIHSIAAWIDRIPSIYFNQRVIIMKKTPLFPLTILILVSMLMAGCTVPTPAPTALPTAVPPSSTPLPPPTVEPAVVQDAAGRTVSFAEPPARIVIAGKATQLLVNAFYLFPEASERIVGIVKTQPTSHDFLSLWGSPCGSENHPRTGRRCPNRSSPCSQTWWYEDLYGGINRPAPGQIGVHGPLP